MGEKGRRIMNNVMYMTNYFLGKMRRIYFMAIPETKQDYKMSRVCYTVSDSAVQTIVQLAGGTFLVALLSYVGVSDAHIGVITSLASLAALSQIFTLNFTNGLKKFKFFVCLVAQFRFLLAFIYFIPFLSISNQKRVWMVVGFYLIAQIFVQIGTPATQDWIASLVPSRLRGKYFSIKDTVAIFVTSTIMLLAGVVLDFYKKKDILTGFFILGCLIFILVVINVVALTKMKEPKMSFLNKDGKEMHGTLAKKAKQEITLEKKVSLSSECKQAFASKRFRKVLFLNLLWMTSFYIAAPFIATYQIKELNIPYTFIMIVNFGACLFRMFLTLRMGKCGDRYGMAKVLKYAFAALGVQYLILALTMPNNAYIMTIIGTLCAAAAWSFIGIGMFGIQLEFLDRDKRIMQLTLMSAISGVYGFGVSWVGGKVLTALQRIKLSIGTVSFYAQQVLFLIGFIMIIVTIFYTRYAIQSQKIEINRQDGKI
jgi:Na+/melibiose symporter-like transporter